MKNMKAYKNIDAYIHNFPDDIQVILQKTRQTIKAAAPQAEETIKYGIPTFTLHGNLVHFGAFKNHISFFPTPHPIEVFKKELSKYQISKGTIQFSFDKPIPYGLIRKIVRCRVKQVMEKSKNSSR